MVDGNPISNFLRVAGHGVTLDFRGVRRLCSRWRLKDQCSTPFCERCCVFGNNTVGCTVGCRHCGDSHESVDYTARRTYSSVTAGQRRAFASSQITSNVVANFPFYVQRRRPLHLSVRPQRPIQLSLNKFNLLTFRRLRFQIMLKLMLPFQLVTCFSYQMICQQVMVHLWMAVRRPQRSICRS